MLHGLSPFDMGFSPFARPQHAPPPTPPRVEPRIRTEQNKERYAIRVDPPEGYALSKIKTKRLDARSLVIEGVLEQNFPEYVEYVVRARTGVYSHPSRSSLVGVIQPGHVVRGSAPSSRGWIACDDDESFILDDGSLVPRHHHARGAPVAFAKRVLLPGDDADLTRLTSTVGDEEADNAEARYEVVFRGPRVAVRAGAHTAAPILASLPRGAVIEGTRDTLDPNWVRLTDECARRAVGMGVAGQRDAFVMMVHPQYGRLLAPLTPPRSHPPPSTSSGGILVRVPRKPHRTQAASSANAGRQAEQHKRRAPEDASAASYNGASFASPPPAAARQRSAASEPPSMSRSTHARDAPTTGADPAMARGGGSRQHAAGGQSATMGGGGPVLCECEAAAENVQSPHETVEAWAAVEGGGFVVMVTA